MKSRVWLILAGLLAVAVFVLLQVVFVVRTGEVAIVTTWGKTEDPITEPGLCFKWPRPAQRCHIFDRRVHCLEGNFEQTLTRDGRNIILMAYAGWRIEDPLKFFTRVGTIAEAERALEGLLRNYKNGVVGQHAFSALVNVNPQELKFGQIENEILAAVRPEALERYGLDVALLGIRRVGLPESTTEAVFKRMRQERESVAVKYRSDGEKEATVIRAQADKEAKSLLAEAEASAKRIKAEGDATAAEYYAVFEKHPELAMFLRKLEALQETMKEKSTVILDTDTVPYDLLRGQKALPAPETQPKQPPK
ncbi:MAG: protease modulator HflC [Kiritimatiellae bacterium]|nr:protease modulator HflC [Kiritimatiellia bacterium]